MFSEISKNEANEIGSTDMPSYRDIKPESGMTVNEANKYLEDLFKGASEVSDGYYKSYEDRLDRTPIDSPRGHWDGVRGESKFIPSNEMEDSKSVSDKLAEKGRDAIEYKNGEPDFSKCAEVTVKIDNMTENRENYYDKNGNIKPGNYSQADIKCADQWNASQRNGRTDWTAVDVREWRHENNCTWHERCDTQTMDLVPREIHDFFRHSGGCAECKARDSACLGGGFDE